MRWLANANFWAGGTFSPLTTSLHKMFILPAMLFALIVPSLSPEGAREPGGNISITAILCDKAGLDAQVLRYSKAQLVRILAEAGIDVHVKDADGAPTVPPTWSGASLENCKLPAYNSDGLNGDVLVIVTPHQRPGARSEAMGLTYQGTSV